jgi:hypothetical protein
MHAASAHETFRRHEASHQVLCAKSREGRPHNFCWVTLAANRLLMVDRRCEAGLNGTRLESSTCASRWRLGLIDG